MLSRNAAPQKKDCLRSRFTFAVNLKRTNPQKYGLSCFAVSLKRCSAKKKDCLRSLFFLAGAVGIEPTP